MLGTGFTAGFDIDSPAIYTARRNLALNGLACPNPGDEPEVELFVGELDCVKPSFHLVAANLAAPLLQRLADTLSPMAASHMILSGIADEMREVVIEAYVSRGLSVMCQLNRGTWNAALLCKTNTLCAKGS